MMSEEEILKIYPNAVWFPGDIPPIGQRVRIEKENGLSDLGTVVGEMPITRKLHEDCPYCKCETEHPFRGWWIVELDNWYKEEHGVNYYKKDKPELNEVPMQTLQYPPKLIPVE